MENNPNENMGIFNQPLEVVEKKESSEKNKLFGKKILLILLAIYLVFAYREVAKMTQFESQFKKNKQVIEQIDQEILLLEEKITSIDQKKEEEIKKVEAAYKILPEKSNKKELIELFESFSKRLSTNLPPFEIKKIEFLEEVKEKPYQLLPFRISAYASQKNLERFIALIELSGNHQENSGLYVPLMRIEKMDISYRGEGENGEDKGVDFNIELKAYRLPSQ